MPYFERKPWAKTAEELQKVESSKIPASNGILELAQSVLRAEMEGSQTTLGPFRCRTPVAPGALAEIHLELAANEAGGPMSLSFVPCELRSRSGDLIPSDLVCCDPPSVSVPAGGDRKVAVQVHVPVGAKAGVYTGQIEVVGSESVAFRIELEVVRPDS